VIVDRPLSLEALPVLRAIAPLGEAHTYFVVRVRAAKVRSGPRPRLSAVLAIDASGSMAGEKIEHVVRSAQRIAEILPETDRLGVVAFADDARVVSPLRSLDAEGRREARAEIARLGANGQTNISAGLALAGGLFADRAADERHVIVLMSDGQPNRGTSSLAGLAAEARERKAKDRAVSTLGFGADHNEELLTAIAEAGGGRYAFVVDPQLAQPSFARALGAQLDVVAERVEMLLAPAEGVEIVRVLGDPRMTVGAGGIRLPLADAVAGDELDVVVELKLRAPREAGPWAAMIVELSGRAAGTHEAILERRTIDLLSTHVGPYDTNDEAERIVTLGLATELRTQALAEAERRQFGAALALLRKAKASLEALTGYVAGASGPVNDAVETLLDDIAAMERMPDQEAMRNYKKAAHDYYGTSTPADARYSRASAPSAGVREMTHAMLDQNLPGARLVGIGGALAGRVIALCEVQMDFGRAHGNAVPVPSPMVSQHHTRIVAMGGAFWVLDLGSTNGTFVNGQHVHKWRLRPGDELRIGDVVLRYEE
jgi:Ca-activated chloride channel family protein